MCSCEMTRLLSSIINAAVWCGTGVSSCLLFYSNYCFVLILMKGCHWLIYYNVVGLLG